MSNSSKPDVHGDTRRTHISRTFKLDRIINSLAPSFPPAMRLAAVFCMHRAASARLAGQLVVAGHGFLSRCGHRCNNLGFRVAALNRRVRDRDHRADLQSPSLDHRERRIFGISSSRSSIDTFPPQTRLRVFGARRVCISCCAETKPNGSLMNKYSNRGSPV